MRIRLLVILLLTLMFLRSHAAVEVPRHFLEGRSGLVTQSLGGTCFVFDITADTLPCNPAFMARERERTFKANIFFGNNVTYAKEASDLLNGRANQDTVQAMFGKKESSEFETVLDMAYLTETIGIALQPTRLSYYTLFRNQVLPQVTLYASQEESLRGQFASYIGNDFYLGAQFRYVHRKFISQDFFLTDALVQDGMDLFNPQEQNLLFFEPGLLYANDDHWLRPQFSMNLVNWGLEDRKYENVQNDPQFHIGGSVTPNLGPGRLGLGIDVFWDKRVESALEPVTLGSFYEFGILKIYGSVSETSQGMGFGILAGAVDLGLAYSNRTVENPLGEKSSFRRVYMLLGVEI